MRTHMRTAASVGMGAATCIPTLGSCASILCATRPRTWRPVRRPTILLVHPASRNFRLHLGTRNAAVVLHRCSRVRNSAKGRNLLGHRVPPHLHPRRRLPRRLCTAATAQRQHAWRLVPLARGFVPPDLGAAATLTLQGSCVLIFRARRERIIEPIARRSRVRGKNGRRFFPL